MLPPAKVVLQIERFHRCRSLVRRLVSLVSIEYLDKVELALDLDVADLPLDQKNVLGVDHLETVFVGILDVVVVVNAGAVGASVVERIVAASFFPVFVSEIGLAAQRLDGLIENRPRLAGAVGVVQVDGGRGGSGRRRWSGRLSALGTSQRAQQQNCKN